MYSIFVFIVKKKHRSPVWMNVWLVKLKSLHSTLCFGFFFLYDPSLHVFYICLWLDEGGLTKRLLWPPKPVYYNLFTHNIFFMSANMIYLV